MDPNIKYEWDFGGWKFGEVDLNMACHTKKSLTPLILNLVKNHVKQPQWPRTPISTFNFDDIFVSDIKRKRKSFKSIYACVWEQ